MRTESPHRPCSRSAASPLPARSARAAPQQTTRCSCAIRSLAPQSIPGVAQQAYWRSAMAEALLTTLIRQLDTAWKLASFHLDGLTTDECLWRPEQRGLHVQRASDGTWRADWPEREGYDIGPPSIAWLTWHVRFWWSMVIDHSFGRGALAREQVLWPGDADAVREAITRLHGEWRAAIEALSDEDLRSSQRTRWPLRDRPFAEVIAWANVELTKNAAEIGYARFLYAVRGR